MSKASIFVDESGDLGWQLDKPRGHGGSSRFLVLAAIVIPDGMNKHVERIVRNLYRQRGRSLGNELKSTLLNNHERSNFARALAQLKEKHAGIGLHAAVAEKTKVPFTLRRKTEILYIHMAEQMLHDAIAHWTTVDIYPDARTVKARDKNSLHNYLEMRLAIAGHEASITTMPSESGQLREIQAADILASIVGAKFEENSSLFDQHFHHAVELSKLF